MIDHLLINALGRVRVFAASGTALVIVEPAADRLQLHLYTDGTAFIAPGPLDVTVTSGIPLISTAPVVIHGRLAQHRWTVISAATPIVAVVEYFPGEDVPIVPAIPTGQY